MTWGKLVVLVVVVVGFAVVFLIVDNCCELERKLESKLRLILDIK